MLSFLNIASIALIDELRVEFEPGLNLLTGETGSGKSIIVDALGLLIGGRFASDLLKAGASRGSVEGLFNVARNPELESLLESAGIEVAERGAHEIIVRRELAASGRNKIFINNQLATQTLLRDLRPFLVDIHGQGDQQTLFNPETHLELLDGFAGLTALRQEVSAAYRRWAALRQELEAVREDEAAKLQLQDTLGFQITELARAELCPGDDERLDEERRRLMNIEKLTALGSESFGLIYEDSDSAITRLRQAARKIEELSQYESNFRAYLEGLESARASIEDLALALRDFTDGLEYSPQRLAEIEGRLDELSRLKRKYGGTIESALEHLARAEERLLKVDRAEEREAELRAAVEASRDDYLALARRLHGKRIKAATAFAGTVERDLADVAMENARFEVRIDAPSDDDLARAHAESAFSRRGIDRVEFFFSANVGEAVRPLARIASGGEASRLMLVLKTAAAASEFPRTIVFDEIDSGIGGRVSEAVGAKLKRLSETNQVLCVTHQAQIARFADVHLLVRKATVADHTEVRLERLDRRGRVEEIARMLTGAEITESARRHARELLKA